jgi:hypothetical protein
MRIIFFTLVFIGISYIVQSQNKTDNKKKYDYSKLKAVFVFGHDDIVNFDYTEVKEIKKFLLKKEVKVKIFFDKSNNWDEIVKASEDANFFYYSGHGTHAGKNKTVGGFVLNEGTISSQKISEKLKLHKNAAVLFQSVCFSAGSSASDNSDIGIKKAENRVINYSLPFIKTGAGFYYANNLKGSMLKFFKDFFNGENIETIYNKNLEFFYTNEITKIYKYKTNYKISIASSTSNSGTITRTSVINGKKTVSKIPNFKSYEIALVYKPGFTIANLFNNY